MRLPTEEEWERAARGADGREYPWGDEFDFGKANVAKKLGVGLRTTAICTYPQGANPEGLWDAAGNVWEWTVSMWEPGSKRTVLRGGSWFYDLGYARCAFRFRYLPGVFFDYGIGFRVVVSLVFPFSEF